MYKKNCKKTLTILLYILITFFFPILSYGKNYSPIVLKGEHVSDITQLINNISTLDKVYSIDFSPDGKIIASGDSYQIRLWDITSGVEIKRFSKHNGIVSSLCFSPNGKYIISGGADSIIYLWDVEKGSVLKQFKKHKKGIESVSFSPNGKFFVSCSTDKSIRLWDSITGNEIKKFSMDKPILTVCFSPNNKYIAFGGVDIIGLMDISSGYKIKKFGGNKGWTLSIGFSPDGKTLASSSYNNILLWDVETGNKKNEFIGHKDLIFSVCFSPDGKNIVSGALDQSVRLWDISTGKETIKFEGHEREVYDISFSPNNIIVASGSMDRTIRLWDISTGVELMQLGGKKLFQALCFSPDSNSIAFSSDKTIRLWDISSFTEKYSFEGHKGKINTLSFNSNGNQIISAGSDRIIHLWDVRSQSNILKFKGHTNNIYSICFNPKDNMIVSGSEDRTVRIWDVKSGKEIKQFNKHKYGVLSVCFSPKGKIVASGSFDQTIRLWDIESGIEISKLTGHDAGVRSICFSPDGKKIASGSDDKSIRLWDITSRTEIKKFNGHNGSILKIDFSPNGKIIASASDDQSIRFWNIESGDEIKKIDDHRSDIYTLEFSPDGKSIVYGSDKILLIKDPLIKNEIQWFYTNLKNNRWLSCKDQKCIRYDDGSIWNTIDKNKRIIPVLPPKPVSSGKLDILSYPEQLEILDGELIPFRVILKNNGKGNIYRISLTHLKTQINSKLVFHPPSRIVVLKPDEIAEMNCNVSVKTSYLHPEGGKEKLSLKFISSYSNLPVLQIPVRINSPAFNFVSATNSKQYPPTLIVSLKNYGTQTIKPKIEFNAKIDNIPLDKIIREKIEANETINLSFALPESLELTKGNLLTVKVRTTSHPIHEWIFSDKHIIISGLSWKIILMYILGVLWLITMIYYLTRQTKSSTVSICLNFYKDIGFKKITSYSKDIHLFINEKNNKQAIVFIYRERKAISKVSTQINQSLKSVGPKTKIYIIYTTHRPETQIMQNLREISKCEVIPISESKLKVCIPQNRQEKKRTLKEFEDPFITRTDPYMESTPINDPTWFYGRHDLIKTLPEFLSQGQHVGLFGLRKVGKTSLVKQIQQRFIATPSVFIDCQTVSNNTDDFFENVIIGLQLELKRLNIKDIPAFKTIDFKTDFYKYYNRLFDQWKKAGNSLPFIIIIDEIDKLFQDRDLKESESSLMEYAHIFKTFRGLAQTNNSLVTMVIAYRPDINRHNLLTSKVGENPMFRSFKEQFLGFLTKKETTSMIREIGKWKDIIWTKDAASKVYDYCGGHPLVSRFFASMACNEGSLKHISTKKVQKTVEEIIKTFRKNDIGNYYEEGIWKLLFEEERSVLSKICLYENITEKQIPEKNIEGLTNLENFGMVNNVNGTLSINSYLFNEWLKRKLSI